MNTCRTSWHTGREHVLPPLMNPLLVTYTLTAAELASGVSDVPLANSLTAYRVASAGVTVNE